MMSKHNMGETFVQYEEKIIIRNVRKYKKPCIHYCTISWLKHGKRSSTRTS